MPVAAASAVTRHQGLPRRTAESAAAQKTTLCRAALHSPVVVHLGLISPIASRASGSIVAWRAALLAAQAPPATGQTGPGRANVVLAQRSIATRSTGSGALAAGAGRWVGTDIAGNAVDADAAWLEALIATLRPSATWRRWPCSFSTLPT